MSAPRPVLLLGATTFSVEVAELIDEMPGLAVAGFVKNLEKPSPGETLEGRPVYWLGDLPGVCPEAAILCALSTTKRKRFTEEAGGVGLEFLRLIHPTAHVSPKVELGEGSLVGVGAIIGAHAAIGRHAIVSRGAMVGHHTRIGDWATIGPASNIAGACVIEEQAYVGIGATIRDHVTVGEGAVIGAGAVVTKDVPARTLVFGAPAKVLKRNAELL